MNILLIGMPASGKSMVGKKISTQLGWGFVDTDQVMESHFKKPLESLVSAWGEEEFLRQEDLTLKSINVDQHVISTSGSSIYSDMGLNHLKENSMFYYLHTNSRVLEERIPSYQQRGVIMKSATQLSDLYESRHQLYSQHCHHLIETQQKSIDDVALEIITHFKQYTSASS